MSRGHFIVIEGGDYGGKTTVVNHLKKVCPDWVYSREPGGESTSQLVRNLVLSDEAKDADVLTKFHLFWASRAENIAKIVRPAVEAGKIVISDRFDASTYAYQIGENPRLEDLFWLTRDVCLQGIVPVYLDFNVSVEVAKERAKGRAETNHFDRWNDDARMRTRSFYDRFFGNKRVKFVKVDADLPQDQLLARAMGALELALSM